MRQAFTFFTFKPTTLLRHWPLDIQGGGGGGGVYRIEKNNRALKFFEKNN